MTAPRPPAARPISSWRGAALGLISTLLGAAPAWSQSAETDLSAAAPGPAPPEPAAPDEDAAVPAGEPDGPALAESEPPVEVTVSAERRAPGSFHALSPRTLTRYGYDDPGQALQLVPGVYVRHEDGFGLRPNIGIRGASSDRSKKVALMEDGIPFAPAPYSAPAAYYFPLMARAYQVKVLKGPAAIAFGPQTIGGAIDIITRPIPIGQMGALDLSAGQYGYGKLHGHYGAGDLTGGFLLEGVHLRSDGFKELPNGADTGFIRNEWSLKANRVFDPQSERVHEVALKVTYSDEASNESYLGLTDDDFRENPRQRYLASSLDRMEWHRTSVVLTHQLEPMDAVTLSTSAYRHDLARVWRKLNGLRGASVSDVLSNPTTPQNSVFLGVLTGQNDAASSAETLLIGPNDRDFVSQGIQSRVEWKTEAFGLAHRIEYGIRLHHDRVERRHSEDGFRVAGGRLLPEGSPTLVNAYNEAETRALALHASDAFSWRGLTITPGLRAELISSTFVDKISGERGGAALQVLLPGIGAHQALTDELGVLFGVHRGMSPPAPGAAEAEPESSVNFEAGARYLGERRRLELIGYYNAYSNLADQCTFSSGCAEADLDLQFDAGRARIYGLEAVAEAELRLGSFQLPLSATYTLTVGEFLETFTSEDPIFGDVESGDELPYVPRHQGRASFGLEYLASGAYVAGTYVSPMRERSGQGPEGVKTDRQLVLDVGAHHELPLARRTRIYAHIRNVTNGELIVSRRPYGARPHAPFSLQVGAQLEF